uniref:Uncharacterized protein n=1 Tax=Setaria italica TaxID=4555 RepID=K3ZKN6_SETIT
MRMGGGGSIRFDSFPSLLRLLVLYGNAGAVVGEEEEGVPSPSTRLARTSLRTRGRSSRCRRRPDVRVDEEEMRDSHPLGAR